MNPLLLLALTFVAPYSFAQTDCTAKATALQNAYQSSVQRMKEFAEDKAGAYGENAVAILNASFQQQRELGEAGCYLEYVNSVAALSDAERTAQREVWKIRNQSGFAYAPFFTDRQLHLLKGSDFTSYSQMGLKAVLRPYGSRDLQQTYIRMANDLRRARKQAESDSPEAAIYDEIFHDVLNNTAVITFGSDAGLYSLLTTGKPFVFDLTDGKSFLLSWDAAGTTFTTRATIEIYYDAITGFGAKLQKTTTDWRAGGRTVQQFVKEKLPAECADYASKL